MIQPVEIVLFIGKWGRLSNRAKPIMRLSIPSSLRNDETTGIRPGRNAQAELATYCSCVLKCERARMALA